MPLPSSIHGRLALLVATVLVPIIGVSLVAAFKVYRDTQAAVSDVAIEAAKALAQVVDRELAVRTTVLKTLASSAALELGDFEAFQRDASKVVPTTQNVIVLIDPTGQQLVNTRVPYGQRALPRATTFASETDSDLTVSDLYMAPLGKSYSFAVRVPVTVAGQSGWYLAMGSFASQLQHVYKQQTMPPTWVSTILDAQGRVVARNKNVDKVIGKSATEDMLERIRSGADGVHESYTLEGDAVTTAFSRVPGTRWTVLIGMPRSEGQAPARDAFALVLGAAALVTLICLVVAARISRTLVEPVHRLQAYGLALGQGEPVEYEPTGLNETDAVSRELAAASLALRRAKDVSKAQVEEAVAKSERAQQAALAAQKLEALGRLTGGIAHDFNNLMQTMTTGLHLLERSCPEGRPRSALSACQRAVEKATQLTRQLMAFGRAQPGYQSTIDVSAYLNDMQNLLRGAIKGSTALKVALPTETLVVRADSVQLELAVLNLVMNARDALNGSGVIELEAKNRVLDVGEIDGLPAGDYVSVTVTDNGDGIAPEHLPRIFEPFFTTKPPGEGTGLGLAQVYAFAKQQGGTAVVATEKAHGTTVTILLPRAGAEPVRESLPVIKPPARRHAGTVLFVEDDSLIQGVVSEALEQAGFTILVASNAEDALALARNRSNLDAVLTDVVMPGGQSGLDMAVALRVLRPALPVMLASGYSDALNGLDGEYPVISKPYDLAELAHRLGELISGSVNVPKSGT